MDYLYRHSFGFLRLIAVLLLIVTFGCPNGGGDDDNKSPKVNITIPIDNTIYDEGDFITFSANCNDKEDGSLTGNSVVWTSSKDGQLSYGASFTVNNLSAGVHVISVVAT